MSRSPQGRSAATSSQAVRRWSSSAVTQASTSPASTAANTGSCPSTVLFSSRGARRLLRAMRIFSGPVIVSQTRSSRSCSASTKKALWNSMSGLTTALRSDAARIAESAVASRTNSVPDRFVSARRAANGSNKRRIEYSSSTARRSSGSTIDPTRGARTTSPSASSARIASRTGPRLVPNCSESATSRRRVPGGNSPATIALRRSSRTLSQGSPRRCEITAASLTVHLRRT
jgi:hypothetical protein